MKRSGVKIFFLTSLFALLSILLLFVIVITALSFFAPKTMANLTYSMGMNNASLYYLEKHSEKTNDINDIYNVVNLSIKVKDKEKIIKHYEKLEKNTGYHNLIININLTNKNSNLKIIEKATLFDEDNYLKNKYVSSLVSLKQFDKAFSYALKNYAGVYTYNYNNQGTYLFGDIFDFINDTNVQNKLNGTYDELIFENKKQQLIEAIIINFQQFSNEFITEIENVSKEKRVPLLALGFRINELAENITQYNSVLSSSISTETINTTIRNINTKMAELII